MPTHDTVRGTVRAVRDTVCAAAPQAEPHGCRRRPMHKVFLRLSDRTLVRLVEAQSNSVDLLRQVSRVLDDLPMPSARNPLLLNIDTTHTKVSVYKPMYFSNICGVVQHRPSEHLVRAGIRPYLTHFNNAFGPSMELYSADCNLVIYQNRSSTLFRGGRDTAAIQNIFMHALDESLVMRVSMHMLVASGNIGHGVCMHSAHIIHALQTDKRWVARHEPRPDTSSCLQIRLHSFDESWMGHMIPPHICAVKSLLMVICISGNVNMFLTPKQPVDFVVGVEHQIRVFYDFFLDYLVQEL